MTKLRPYQETAVAAVIEKWDQDKRLLLIAPTGSGKTIIFSHIAHRTFRTDGGKTLILAHRDELIDQAIDKLERATGLRAGKEKAGSLGNRRSTVTVGSVQTLKGTRLANWPPDYFARIIVDECHHIVADSYQRILSHFSDAKVLGCTATADRGDKRNLGQYFDEIAFEISLIDLIRDGYLSPIKVHTVPIKIDLKDVRMLDGDLAAEGTAHAIEPYLEEIASIIAREFKDRKTLVFLPRIALSEKFAILCQERGLLAEHADGTSPDRAEILERFTNNQTRLLSNCSLLSEGFDEPSIDCVVCLRPTRIRSLFAQMAGRGTRTSPGKTELLLIDFLWLTHEHSLIQAVHLVSSDNREAASIARHIQGGTGDLLQAKDRSDQERISEGQKLAARLAANRHRNAKTFDALEFAVALRDLAIADYEPTMHWHTELVTEKQTAFLSKYGIDPTTVKDRGQAHQIIARIMKRWDLKLATPRQVRWLVKSGHPQPHLCTFAQAKEFLDHLWARPTALST
jgi:superfamily II DNA or RNA helicase